MLHKYSIEECIEQCNKFDAENGVDDYAFFADTLKLFLFFA